LLSADNESRHKKAAGPAADNPAVAVPHQTNPELVDTLPWTDPAWVDLQVRRRMSREDLKILVWLLQAEGDEYSQ
jgi:hypothetical protein